MIEPKLNHPVVFASLLAILTLLFPNVSISQELKCDELGAPERGIPPELVSHLSGTVIFDELLFRFPDQSANNPKITQFRIAASSDVEGSLCISGQIEEQNKSICGIPIICKDVNGKLLLFSDDGSIAAQLSLPTIARNSTTNSLATDLSLSLAASTLERFDQVSVIDKITSTLEILEIVLVASDLREAQLLTEQILLLPRWERVLGTQTIYDIRETAEQADLSSKAAILCLIGTPLLDAVISRYVDPFVRSALNSRYDTFVLSFLHETVDAACAAGPAVLASSTGPSALLYPISKSVEVLKELDSLNEANVGFIDQSIDFAKLQIHALEAVPTYSYQKLLDYKVSQDAIASDLMTSSGLNVGAGRRLLIVNALMMIKAQQIEGKDAFTAFELLGEQISDFDGTPENLWYKWAKAVNLGRDGLRDYANFAADVIDALEVAEPSEPLDQPAPDISQITGDRRKDLEAFRIVDNGESVDFIFPLSELDKIAALSSDGELATTGLEVKFSQQLSIGCTHWVTQGAGDPSNYGRTSVPKLLPYLQCNAWSANEDGSHGYVQGGDVSIKQSTHNGELIMTLETPDIFHSEISPMNEFCVFTVRNSLQRYSSMRTIKCRGTDKPPKRPEATGDADTQANIQAEEQSTSARISPLGTSTLSISTGGAYFDPTYNVGIEELGIAQAQHIGIDLPSPVGTTVVSPIDGVVLANHTDLKNNFAKFLVIVDDKTGQQHVLGHIVSDLKVSTSLEKGDPVGQIVKAGRGPHVHWGINSTTIPISPKNGWGWGRAPLSATKQQAAVNGWIDPSVWLAKQPAKTLSEEIPEERAKSRSGLWTAALKPALSLKLDRTGRLQDGSLISFGANGSVSANNETVTRFRVHDPDQTVLNVYPSPTDLGLLFIATDVDFGGLEIASFAKGSTTEVTEFILGRERDRVSAMPQAAWRVMEPIHWSRSGKHAAFRISKSEWQADLAVLDITSGKLTTFAPDDLGPGSWAIPVMRTLNVLNGGWLEVEFEILECKTAGCTIPSKTGSVLATYKYFNPMTNGTQRHIPNRVNPEDSADGPGALDDYPMLKIPNPEELRSNPASLQMALNYLDYDAGDVDGFPGPQTRTALMGFQAQHCLPQTGQPDDATIKALATAKRFNAPCSWNMVAKGITANTPLIAGKYVRDLEQCKLDPTPWNLLWEQVLVDGTSIMLGHENLCTTLRTDIRDGITLFRGSCSWADKTQKASWRLDVLSNSEFKYLSQNNTFGGLEPSNYKRCPSKSDMKEGYFKPARGTVLRRTILDAVRPTADYLFGSPVEFVVKELRVFDNQAYVNLHSQRPDGAQINPVNTPAFKRGEIDPNLGNNLVVSGFLRRTHGKWDPYDIQVGATEAWWIGGCSDLEELMPETCSARRASQQRFESCKLLGDPLNTGKIFDSLAGRTLIGRTKSGSDWVLNLSNERPSRFGKAEFTNSAGDVSRGQWFVTLHKSGAGALCQGYNGDGTSVCHEILRCSDNEYAMRNGSGEISSHFAVSSKP